MPVVRLLAIGFLPLLAAAQQDLSWRQSGFTASPENWISWSPRPEIAPRTFVDNNFSTGEPGSLAISGNSNAASFGGWERRIDNIRPGRWYRFAASYRASGITHENLQVLARLDWRTAAGKRAGQPEYVWQASNKGEWRTVALDAAAPPNATVVAIQLYLQNAPQGTVWWDDISLQSIHEPGPRKVTVAAVNLRPRNTTSREASVEKFRELVATKVTSGTDLILLPEGITIVGNGKKYADVAETIPGPTTATLSSLAKAKNAWIAAGIYEREGTTFYNTAVLIDRKGNVAGKYRKVYLPREEVEGGLTPGNDYPVFETDFGKVGLMICWDLQYADPARALALRGAEMILVPIWGGNETLGKARAIENRVFIASSGYDYPTYVMDPDGEILSIARENGTLATATIDLNRNYADKWLGDMRGRLRKELRTDVRVE